jgi:hypothetical protein
MLMRSRFFNFEVGDLPQTIQADLDMLSPDFYTPMTTSGNGSQYSFFSRSRGPYRYKLQGTLEAAATGPSQQVDQRGLRFLIFL